MDTLDLYVRDYTLSPGPRYSSQGEYSGEDFYNVCLKSAFCSCIENNKRLIVHLDGVDGYPVSFLDEAFGKLVYDYSRLMVEKIITIETNMFSLYKEAVIDKTYNKWEKYRTFVRCVKT